MKKYFYSVCEGICNNDVTHYEVIPIDSFPISLLIFNHRIFEK